MNLVSNLWFFLAFGSSVFWGLGYIFVDKVLKAGLNPFLLLAFMVVPQAFAYAAFFLLGNNSLKEQIRILQTPSMTGFLIAAILFFILGNACIFSSIQMKNASLANIIEISYPIFVVLFSWLIFKENNVNMYSYIGGFLIFSGVTLVLLKG